MSTTLFDKFLGRSPVSFVRAARKRGLTARVARLLEPAAREIAPTGPEGILESRELFQDAATRAVLGHGANLELSFRLADVLATAVEKLSLARASDVPDPFRRVWVDAEDGKRRPGVVLTISGEEIAVFCPPEQKELPPVGSKLHLQYRGFHSVVEYDLRLNDAVRLPGGLVFHLTRFDGRGSIGRGNQRYPVRLNARVHALDAGEEEDYACQVLDVSSGGMRMDCARAFDADTTVSIEVDLGDGDQGPFAFDGMVCWSRDAGEGMLAHGLLFPELPQQLAERFILFLRAQPHPQTDSESSSTT